MRIVAVLLGVVVVAGCKRTEGPTGGSPAGLGSVEVAQPGTALHPGTGSPVAGGGPNGPGAGSAPGSAPNPVGRPGPAIPGVAPLGGVPGVPGVPGAVTFVVDGGTRSGSDSTPSIDCDRLLGAARASALLGVDVKLIGKAAFPECHYQPSSADASVRLDIVVACQAEAMHYYRETMRGPGPGRTSVPVGQHAVRGSDANGPFIIFVDEKSPCGAEVRMTPAAKLEDAAREIARNLAPATRGIRQ